MTNIYKSLKIRRRQDGGSLPINEGRKPQGGVLDIIGAPNPTPTPDEPMTLGRGINQALSLADYYTLGIPSTAAGLVNAAIPYQPLGGLSEAKEAVERGRTDLAKQPGGRELLAAPEAFAGFAGFGIPHAPQAARVVSEGAKEAGRMAERAIEPIYQALPENAVGMTGGKLTPPKAVAAEAVELDPLGYYSRALESAKSLKQEKGTPDQILRQLNAKESELEATGLRDFLKDKQTVTKSELIDYLRNNRIQMLEQVYAPKSADMPNLPHTMYDTWTFDELNPKNREITLYLPFSEKDMKSGVYVDKHFPVHGNTVGNLLTTHVETPTGEPVFLVSQVQSQWGQDLRKYGLRDNQKIRRLSHEIDELRYQKENRSVEASDRLDELGVSVPEGRYVPESIEDVTNRIQQALRDPNTSNNITPYLKDIESTLSQSDDELQRQIVDRIRQRFDATKAPTVSHPTVKNTDRWLNLMLSRALREAAMSDAEYIAFPSGQTVLTYNEGQKHGMENFYNDIVPKNVKNLLSKLVDLKKTNEKFPTHSDKLVKSTGEAGGEGFTLFRLTPEIKAAIKEKGFEMYRATGGSVTDRMHRARKGYAAGGTVEDLSPEDKSLFRATPEGGQALRVPVGGALAAEEPKESPAAAPQPVEGGVGPEVAAAPPTAQETPPEPARMMPAERTKGVQVAEAKTNLVPIDPMSIFSAAGPRPMVQPTQAATQSTEQPAPATRTGQFAAPNMTPVDISKMSLGPQVSPAEPREPLSRPGKILKGVFNIPVSTVHLGYDALKALTVDLPQTAKNLKDLAIGTADIAVDAIYDTIQPGRVVAPTESMKEKRDLSKALYKMYKDKYFTSIDNFLDAWAEDPAAILSDLSMALGGVSLAPKLTGAARAAEAAKAAETFAKAQKLSSVAKPGEIQALSPLALPPAEAGVIARGSLKAQKFLQKAASATDPFILVGGAASGLAKKGYRSVVGTQPISRIRPDPAIEAAINRGHIYPESTKLGLEDGQRLIADAANGAFDALDPSLKDRAIRYIQMQADRAQEIGRALASEVGTKRQSTIDTLTSDLSRAVESNAKILKDDIAKATAAYEAEVQKAVAAQAALESKTQRTVGSGGWKRGEKVPETPLEAAEGLKRFITNAEQSHKSQTNSLYNAARAIKGQVKNVDVFDDIGSKIQKLLKSKEIDINWKLSPNAQNAVEDISEFFRLAKQEGLPLTINELENARKMLVSYRDAAISAKNKTDMRAIRHIIDEFENFRDAELLSGNFSSASNAQKALDLLDKARSSHAQYMDRYVHRPGNRFDVADLLSDIVNPSSKAEDIVSKSVPQKAADFTNANKASEFIRLAEAVEEIFGKNSPAFRILRNSAFETIRKPIYKADGTLDRMKMYQNAQDAMKSNYAKYIFDTKNGVITNQLDSWVQGLKAAQDVIDKSQQLADIAKAQAKFSERAQPSKVTGKARQVFDDMVEGRPIDPEAFRSLFSVALSRDPSSATEMIRAMKQLEGYNLKDVRAFNADSVTSLRSAILTDIMDTSSTPRQIVEKLDKLLANQGFVAELFPKNAIEQLKILRNDLALYQGEAKLTTPEQFNRELARKAKQSFGSGAWRVIELSSSAVGGPKARFAVDLVGAGFDKLKGIVDRNNKKLSVQAQIEKEMGIPVTKVSAPGWQRAIASGAKQIVKPTSQKPAAVMQRLEERETRKPLTYGKMFPAIRELGTTFPTLKKYID